MVRWDVEAAITIEEPLFDIIETDKGLHGRSSLHMWGMRDHSYELV